jgi:long-chain acyl-CoA synthetase
VAGLGDVVRRAAAADPGRLALVDGGLRLTWAELDRAVTRAALALGADLGPGARIALQLGTSADFVTLYLGALRAGLVVVPVNPGYTLPELRHVLEDSRTALVVTASVAAIEAAAELPVARVVVAAPSAPEAASTLGELLSAAQPTDDPHGDRDGEDLAVLLYTSGTSGRPKAAMLSVRALVANLDHLMAVEPPLLGPGDVAFIPLPLFHVFGLNGGLGIALRAGATTVLSDRFDPVESLDLMRRERVSTLIGAPGMYAQWLSRPGFAAGFAAVRTAITGSAPLRAALVGEYARRSVTLREGYGLTEAASAVTLNGVSPRAGSIGRPLPGVEVSLRDVDGDPVEDENDPGQLYIRGRNLFSGYWPDGAGGPDEEGWFGTGDIAVADEGGNLTLVGRTDDLVLVNGFNVYPAEVEAVLGAVRGVAEVAVVGVDDADTGEAVVAYVVPAPGTQLRAPDLLAAAARSLARFKLPRSIEFVDELPHTVTGKVMKWRLSGA